MVEAPAYSLASSSFIMVIWEREMTASSSSGWRPQPLVHGVGKHQGGVRALFHALELLGGNHAAANQHGMAAQGFLYVYLPVKHHGIVGADRPALVHIVEILPCPGKGRTLFALYSVHAQPLGGQGLFIMNGEILSNDADGIHPVCKQQGGYGGEGDGARPTPLPPGRGE